MFITSSNTILFFGFKANTWAKSSPFIENSGLAIFTQNILTKTISLPLKVTSFQSVFVLFSKKTLAWVTHTLSRVKQVGAWVTKALTLIKQVSTCFIRALALVKQVSTLFNPMNMLVMPVSVCVTQVSTLIRQVREWEMQVDGRMSKIRSQYRQLH